MAEQNRAKGQFLQAGMPFIVPKIAGSFLSVDGMVDFNSIYLQADYPALFAVLGTAYNKEGDNNATQFRTPTLEDWGLLEDGESKHKWMIRF